MNYFNNLTDHALRRVYKFVLKRTIGKYLRDELVLEQLRVNSREGHIELNSLYFDCDVINEEFLNYYPIRIVELSINSLKIHLSYLNLLTDSLRFVVDDVDVVVQLQSPDSIPRTNTHHPSSSSLSLHQTVEREEDDIDIPVEGETGLSFIAHWIETILHQLKVDCNRLCIKIQSSFMDQFFEINLESVSLYNGGSVDYSTGLSSSQFAEKLMTSSSLKSKFLSKTKKRCILSGFTGFIGNGSTKTDLLSCSSKIHLDLKLEGNRGVNGIEIDAKFPSVEIFLNSEVLISLLRLFSVFNESSAKMTKVASSAVTKSKTHHFDALLNSEMEKVYLKPLEDTQLPRKTAEEEDETVDSDGEFPLDKNDSDDFEDALSRPLGFESFADNRSRYFSTLEFRHSQKFEARVRIFVESVKVELLSSQPKPKRLQLFFHDFVALYSNSSHQAPSEENAFNCSITINDFTAFEIQDNRSCLILKSSKDMENAIYSKPDVAIVLQKELEGIRVDITLEPFEILLSLEFMNHWMDWVSSLTPLEPSSSSSSAPVIININWNQLRVALRGREVIDSIEFKEFLSFWDVWLNWSILNSPVIGCNSYRGGFYFDFQRLNLTVDHRSSGVELSLSLETATVSTYCGSPGSRTFVSAIITLLSEKDTAVFALKKAAGLDQPSTQMILSLNSLKVDLRKMQFHLASALFKDILSETETRKELSRTPELVSIEMTIRSCGLFFDGSEEYSDFANHRFEFEEPLQAVLEFLAAPGRAAKALAAPGPSLLLLGAQARLTVTLDSSGSTICVSVQSLEGREIQDEGGGALSFLKSPLEDFSRRGREFVRANADPTASSGGIAAKILVTLRSDASSTIREISDISVELQKAMFTVSSESSIWLELPDLLLPLTLQQTKSHILQRLIKELSTMTTEENESVLKDELLSNLLFYFQQNFAGPQGRDSFESVRISIFSKELVLKILDKKCEDFGLFNGDNLRFQLHQLSQLKSLSLKLSCDKLSFGFSAKSQLLPLSISIDFVSVLVNLIASTDLKKMIDVGFGKISGRSSIRDLMRVMTFFESFGTEITGTFTSFAEKSKDLPDSLLMQRDKNAWEQLFRPLEEAGEKGGSSKEDKKDKYEHLSAVASSELISSQDEEDQLWEADYGTEVASQPLFNRDDPEIAISGKETESLMDALSVSVPDFEQLEFLNDQEIELKSTILPSKSQAVVEQVQPGLTEEDMAEMEEIDFIWNDQQEDFGDGNAGSLDLEQQATWFVDPDALEINHYYLHGLVNPFRQNMNFVTDPNFATSLRISMNLHFILHTASPSAPTSLETDSEGQINELDLHVRDIVVELFSFLGRSTGHDSQQAVTQLQSKLTVSLKELLVSHRTNSRLKHYKVLGLWNRRNELVDGDAGVVKLSVWQFADPAFPAQTEFRVKLFLRPFRCHLTEQFLSLVKIMVSEAVDFSSEMEQSDPHTLYFQQVTVLGFDVKIDYHASGVNISSLNEGDYLQLLNIFPLDGLELHLKSIKLNGVNGALNLVHSILEVWVTDIYKNQLHRVLTGTTPFKSIANIGSSLQGLLFIPLRDRRQKQQMWRQVTRETKSVISAVTTEALNLTHQASLLLANTITDFTSETRSRDFKKIQQPKNLREGLQRAAKEMKSDIKASIDHVVAVPLRQYEQVGARGVIKSVIRALPVAILRPIAGAANGISYTVLGLRNSLNPSQIQEEEDLWESVEQDH